ncbi:PH domain-containing protein [Rhodococcus sp. NPDC058521]|uniref:PH domain-containing protein n=1 Tax=Rhodococcus sp. NPDC058521 TaxID=3346536 RepID=UPI0036467642
MSEQGRIEWATPWSVIGALAIGGLALFGASFLVSTEPAGRVLVTVAAVVMLASAASGAVQRPRLAAHTEGAERGITVRKLTGQRSYPQSAITRVRLVRYPRLGRRVPMLEIDASEPDGGERLLIFGRWDLGTSPQDVFDAFAAHGLVPAEKN